MLMLYLTTTMVMALTRKQRHVNSLRHLQEQQQ
jgi:hypothetical protein